MSLRQAAEMALEAMEKYCECGGLEDPIEALRQALDYPTPEQISLAQQIRSKGKSRIGQALAQEQELTEAHYKPRYNPTINAFDTAPPKKEWVGLTEEDFPENATYGFVATARWAEAKLKEKNT